MASSPRRKSTRLLASCLSILLGSGVLALPADAQTAPGTASIAIDSSIVVAGVPFEAHVTGLEPYLDPSAVQNGAFSSDLSAWSASFAETGGSGFASWRSEPGREGFARLVLDGAEARGTAHLSQSMAAPGAPAFRLEYAARATRGDVTLAMLLREQRPDGSAYDTVTTHALQDGWQAYAWSLVSKAPDATSRTLFLRFEVEPGANHTVDFDDVRLRGMPSLSWQAPQADLLEPRGERGRLRYDRPGTYDLRVLGERDGIQVFVAQQTLAITNRAPEAALAPFAQPRTATERHVFDATASFDPDQAAAVRDPSFRRLGTDWTVDGREARPQRLGATGVDADGRSWLRLDVEAPAQSGNVFAFQRITLPSPEPLGWSVLVRDDGRIESYKLILRSTLLDGTRVDSTFEFPPTAGKQRLLAGDWEPPSNETVSLEWYLRAGVFAGRSARVEFAEPRVVAGLRFTWQLDEEAPQNTSTPVLDRFVHEPGLHQMRLRVTDRGGLWTERTLLFTTRLPDVSWGYQLPPVFARGIPLELNATALHRGGDENLLQNPAFDAGLFGWTVAADLPSGERARILLDGEDSFVRVSARGDAFSSVYLRQDVGPDCLRIACELSFRYRSEASEERLALIVRGLFTSSAVDPTLREVDRRLQADAGPQWRHAYLPLSFSGERGVAQDMRVFLRFFAPAGRDVSMDFDDVVLRPALGYQWSAGGAVPNPLKAGPVQKVVFTQAGVHAVNLSVSDQWGVWVHREDPVAVIDLDIYRTLGGEVGFRWPRATQDVSGSARLALQDATGRMLWNQSLAEPAQLTGPQPGRVAHGADFEYAFLTGSATRADSGSVLRLESGAGFADLSQGWHVDSPLRGAFFNSRFQDLRSGPRQFLHLDLLIEDRSIVAVRAELRRGEEVVASGPLAGGDGNFSGDMELPADLPKGSYIVYYTTTDVLGRNITIFDARRWNVDPENPLVQVAWAVGALLALVAATVGGRAWIRRRRRT